MKTTPKVSKRVQSRLRALRRDPMGRFGLELNRYLATIGWTAVVIGDARIEGVEQPGFGKYRFSIGFSGGRLKQEAK